MIQMIQQEYGKLTKKQQKAIYWALKITGTELSKAAVMLLLFLLLGKGWELLFTMAVLFPIRSRMGGLHYKTYWGCLSVSILLFFGAIVLFPAVLPVTKETALILLCICMGINIATKPVINPTRPTLTKSDIQKTRRRIGIYLTAYALATYIFYNHYFLCGMWMIVEQTLQLLIAAIKKNMDRKEVF